MIVELNDEKFIKAKKGDIFVIENIDGKNVAVPITKEELLKCEIETLKSLQKQINNLKSELKKQKEVIKKQNQKIATYSESIYKFINIMNGGNTNEETI